MAYDEDLADRIRSVAGDDEPLTEKRMFGGIAFLLGGQMAVAASGQGGLMVRVDPDRAAALLDEPHVAPMEMRGSELTGWLRVDGAALDSEESLRRWVEIGLARVRALSSDVDSV